MDGTRRPEFADPVLYYSCHMFVHLSHSTNNVSYILYHTIQRHDKGALTMLAGELSLKSICGFPRHHSVTNADCQATANSSNKETEN